MQSFFLWLKQVFFHIVTNESSRGLVVWAWWFECMTCEQTTSVNLDLGQSLPVNQREHGKETQQGENWSVNEVFRGPDVGIPSTRFPP